MIRLVDSLQGTVFLFQPHPEFFRTTVAAAKSCFHFIIYLPGCQIGHILIVLSHFSDKLLNESAVRRRIIAPVPPYCRLLSLSIPAYLQDFRIFFIQPQRRAIGGRTQNNLNIPVFK